MAENNSIRNLGFIKSMLLVTVILGHISALTLPNFSELSGFSFNVVLLIILKGISGFGREAAYLFVLFSGYATAHHFSNCNRSNATRSVASRLIRLYPPFAFALLSTIILDKIGAFISPPFYEDSFPFTYSTSEHSAPSILLCNAAMLQPTVCNSYGTNGPLWTIGYLMQFYLVAWFLRMLTRNTECVALLGGVLSVVAYIALSVEWFALFALWIFGMNLRISFAFQERQIPVLALVAIIFFGLIFAKLNGPLRSIILMAPVGTALLILSKRDWAPAPKCVEIALVWLGGISFQLYLLHMPVLAVLAATSTSILGSINEGSISFLAMSTATMLLTYILIAAYQQVEKQIIRK